MPLLLKTALFISYELLATDHAFCFSYIFYLKLQIIQFKFIYNLTYFGCVSQTVLLP